MDLMLQFGYGMRGLSQTLLKRWGGGTVILSPRDLNATQLVAAAAEVVKEKGEPMLDPQCYSRQADHKTLTSHEYWKVFRAKSTKGFLTGEATVPLLKELAALANKLGITRHILPGLIADPVNDDWFTFHENIQREAPNHFKGELFTTVALSAKAVRDEAQVEAIVERAERWKVSGVYVVVETPTSYLVDDPIWLANVMILVSGLKLLGKTVVVGYGNHQLLSLAVAKVDGLASGTWLNVRAFPLEKFSEKDEDQVSRRAIWYYCPQALSEYKLPFLDAGQKAGILGSMKAPTAIDGAYAEPLFGGPAPSTINWNEPQPFLHYLSCLKSQLKAARKGSFQQTLDAHRRILDTAEAALKTFRQNGVLGQDRDFKDYIDVSRGALVAFLRAREPLMRKAWTN